MTLTSSSISSNSSTIFTLSAFAIFSMTVIETFLSPFSMLGMYVLSRSAWFASASCVNPFSSRNFLTWLPNFFFISMSTKVNISRLLDNGLLSTCKLARHSGVSTFAIHTSQHASQKLQKSFHLSRPMKNYFLKFPSLLKFSKPRPHSRHKKQRKPEHTNTTVT